MGESNAQYYASRDPLGAAGDFITAPEISQMFGELVGLWLADMWHRAGRPAPVLYVELGPGLGTLARDALRAMRQAGLVPLVHLIEASGELRRVQRRAVPDAVFHDDLGTLPTGPPVLLAANEFLDALPIRQLVRTPAGWRERMVATDAQGQFVFVSGDRPLDAALPAGRREAEVGAIFETSPAAAAITNEIAARLAAQGGAALVIDYGYVAPQFGSTLQAVSRHRKLDPFATPGEADLTAHVDFGALAAVAEGAGARWLGTATQGEWLDALGIGARAGALAAAAPERRDDLALTARRLTDPAHMGELFKVMGLSAPHWPAGEGFHA
ncbi:MAG: SAM-dependent methyltransferase [Croceibacterium sp.]